MNTFLSPASSTRMLVWIQVGVAFGLVWGLLESRIPMEIGAFGFIGTVAGLVAGYVSNVRTRWALQALLAGLSTGLAVGVLYYLMFHPPHSLPGEVLKRMVGCTMGFFVFRVLLRIIPSGNAFERLFAPAR